MEELSSTICHERKLFTAVNNVNDEPSFENWQALLAEANKVNELAVVELSQLKAELVELTVSAMNLTYPLDSVGEEEAMHEHGDLYYHLQEKMQLFLDINDIRLGAQQESERAVRAIDTLLGET